MNDKEELENFKRINLAELAASYGYKLDGRPYPTGYKMRNGDNIIVVSTAPDGHMIYFGVQGKHSDKGGGVPDFVMNEEGVNLGYARKILREYTGAQRRFAFPAAPHFSKPIIIARDRAGVIAAWEQMKPYRTGYLEGRGIKPRTISKFADHIRTDQRGNTCFLHEDKRGISGYEVKNTGGWAGFASGGRKALFMCSVGEQEPPERIVITEGAIDTLSYYQMNPADGLYVSFAGGLSPEQREQLTVLLTSHPQTTVIIATDKDTQGEIYAVFIRSIRPDAQRAAPPMGKDWNDSVMQRGARAR